MKEKGIEGWIGYAGNGLERLSNRDIANNTAGDMIDTLLGGMALR